MAKSTGSKGGDLTDDPLMQGGKDKGHGLWRIWLVVDDPLADPLEEVLANFGPSISRFEEKPTEPGAAPRWRIQVLCDDKPAIAEVALSLAAAAGQLGIEFPDFHVQEVAETDWLALNRSQFPPIRAGRFHVYGRHVAEPPPEGTVALRLDAGPAFGSGTHETTRGCLHAIDELIEEWRFDKALDLGCGSGILALALAKGAGIRVVAADMDETAVRTTAENAVENDLAHLVDARVADAPGAPSLADAGPFDLVVANILAEPLIAFADQMPAIMGDDSILVLSGLLSVQEKDVLEPYRRLGYRHRRTIVLGDWSTLVLGRGKSG